MADLSGKNSTYNLHFQLKPAKILKNAITALADPDFNPYSSALIEAGQLGFEITVRSVDYATKDTVFGFLRLKATGLVDFECITPLKKRVFLNHISPCLDSFEDDDVVSVYLDNDAPNVLCFKFGAAPNDPIGWILFEENALSMKFPNVSYGYGAIIPSKDLEAMAEGILNLELKRRSYCVSVDIDAKTGMKAGDFEVKTVTANHHCWFVWRHWGSLKKASVLAEKCVLCLVIAPDKSVLLRFSLEEVGDFVFLQRQDVLFHDEEQLACIGHFNSLL